MEGRKVEGVLLRWLGRFLVRVDLGCSVVELVVEATGLRIDMKSSSSEDV